MWGRFSSDEKQDPDTILIASRSSSKFLIERYLSTLVDNEPASACAILSATTRQSPIAEIWNPKNDWWTLDAQRIPDTDEVQNESDMADSVSGTYVTSNASSFGSSVSASSYASFSSSLGRTPRRGRRRYKNSIKESKNIYLSIMESNKRYEATRQNALKTKRPAFFCTSCGNPYMTRYEWKRHEESVHVTART